MITQEHLKELLYYHPESGDFVWLVQLSPKGKVGTQAGSLDGRGYLRIVIYGVKYKAHRLAYMYQEGVLPLPHIEVDHRNTRRHENWWHNLRHANKYQNKLNVKRRRDNQSGHKNISWHSRDKKFCVRVNVNGAEINIGRYTLLSDAISARDKGLATHAPDWART